MSRSWNVSGSAARARNIGRDIVAVLRNIAGGEVIIFLALVILYHELIVTLNIVSPIFHKTLAKNCRCMGGHNGSLSDLYVGYYNN